MSPGAAPTPGFGQADLSNCEREQIHLTASIQPHGALLVLREPDLTVIQASANAQAFLELAEPPLGRPLRALARGLHQCIAPLLAGRLDQIPVMVRCALGSAGRSWTGLVHRTAAGELILELQPWHAATDVAERVAEALQSIPGAPSLRSLCDHAARLFKDLTGYDRVMIYRFDAEGHGEVYAEEREPELESYRGNHYPASDIPQIARRLYERNRIRLLVDVGYQPVPLEPRLSPLTGRDVDLSLAFLRSMSPIHIQYLKNMGVAATLVISLMVGGRLWGLVACHHYRPRDLPHTLRVACELLGEVMATRIAALEGFARVQAELAVRRLEQRMIEAISREGDWRHALFDGPQTLLQPLKATGAALLVEGQVLTAGEVPSTADLRAIGRWLDRQPRQPVIATASLGTDEPAFAHLTAVASGLIATPVSRNPGEYLLWCRPERVHTVTWGGNPFKAVVIGNDPADLSPRRSFAQWHQVVEGTADAWSDAELAAAPLIGDCVADMLLQFRSVRLLLAQEQLKEVTQQVRHSDQAVIIADVEGRILLANDAFLRLLPAAAAAPATLEELGGLWEASPAARKGLRQAHRQLQSWRGEVRLRCADGLARPFQVRADPVLAGTGQPIGCVLLLTDLTEQRAAESARRLFQEGIVEQRRLMQHRLDSRADLAYRDLLSHVVGNAQLAALEITDSVDLAGISSMLESVRLSVTRTAELLEQLMRHATPGGD